MKLSRCLLAMVSLLVVACAGATGGVAPSATVGPNPAKPALPSATPVPAAAPSATPIPPAPTTAAKVLADRATLVTSTAVATSPAGAKDGKPPQPVSKASHAGRIMWAYYVPYDTTSWASLRAHADQIDYVVTQTVFVNACGGISAQDDRTLKAFAKAHDVNVIASVFTVDASVNHRLLTDDATSAAAIRTLANYAVEEGYAGLDVDLEGVAAADRPALTAFVARLSDQLHQRGKLLTMAVPAKASDTRTGWAGAYDYAALAPHVDLVTIMSYDFSWSGGPPGSIAPYSWVDRVIGYATSQFPPTKVLLGVAFYGYDWNVTTGGRARALRYPQAEVLANRYGASIGFDQSARSATFRYQAKPGDQIPTDTRPPALNHEIHRLTPPACSIPTPTPVPTTPQPRTQAGQHVVWIEDAQSAAARLDIAAARGTGGIATWRLGQEDPTFWQRLGAWRSGQTP